MFNIADFNLIQCRKLVLINVRSISIPRNVSVVEIIDSHTDLFVSAMPNLIQLTIEMRIVENDIRTLQYFPNLTDLRLFTHGYIYLDELKSCKKLSSLQIGRDGNYEKPFFMNIFTCHFK